MSLDRGTIRHLLEEHLTRHPRAAGDVDGPRIEALLAEALDRPKEARESFLDAACAADPRLREELAALVAATRPSGRPTAKPSRSAAWKPASSSSFWRRDRSRV